MGKVASFLKQFGIVLFLCFIFPNTECTDIKFDNFDLGGKQLFIIKDVDISSKYNFETLNADATCNSTNKCANGGSCYNNECICLPGTSGPLCKTINGCSDLNCSKDKNANCDFDKRNFKAFCKCPWGEEFDYDENKCRECRCDDCKKGAWCSGAMKCEFIRGEKTCTCALPVFKFNPKTKICDICSCLDNFESCDFDDDGNKKCKCKSGYAQNGYSCDRCNCYNGDGCKFVNYNKVCICRDGYVDHNGDCYRCSCGANGKCVFDPWNHNQKRCDCNPGFMEIEGICKEISDCYCGENSNCTLKSDEKMCSCQEGFTYMSGLCADINECDNPKTCPENKKCYNLIGSYNCSCADGFQPSDVIEGECVDINECRNGNSCPGSDTECFNTVGSFRCVCKPGFVTRDGIAANPICENKSSWKLGFGLLIGIFLAIIIGLIIVIYRKS